MPLLVSIRRTFLSTSHTHTNTNEACNKYNKKAPHTHILHTVYIAFITIHFGPFPSLSISKKIINLLVQIWKKLHFVNTNSQNSQILKNFKKKLQRKKITMTDCKEQLNVDFIVLQGDATLAALEDDIRTNLEQVGVTVNTRFLAKADLNTAMTSGDFNLCFSETWGPPYDPHTFAASFDTPDEAYYAALSGLPAPKNQAWIADKVDAVLEEEDESERYTKWSEILTALHEQATEIPFSGTSHLHKTLKHTHTKHSRTKQARLFLRSSTPRESPDTRKDCNSSIIRFTLFE